MKKPNDRRPCARWGTFGTVQRALLVWMLLAAVAHAQGPDLVSSDPADGAVLSASPSRVTAWFSSELAPEQSVIRVFDSQGRQVGGNGTVGTTDPSRASLGVDLPSLPDGRYTVVWRAVRADGMAGEGQFGFAVGPEAAGGQGAGTLPSWLGPVLAIGVGIATAFLMGRLRARQRAR